MTGQASEGAGGGGWGARGSTPHPPPASLIIRAPNHLGDLVMAVPALERAGAADVQVVRFLAPLLRMARLSRAVLALDRGAAGFRRAVR